MRFSSEPTWLYAAGRSNRLPRGWPADRPTGAEAAVAGAGADAVVAGLDVAVVAGPSATAVATGADGTSGRAAGLRLALPRRRRRLFWRDATRLPLLGITHLQKPRRQSIRRRHISVHYRWELRRPSSRSRYSIIPAMTGELARLRCRVYVNMFAVTTTGNPLDHGKRRRWPDLWEPMLFREFHGGNGYPDLPEMPIQKPVSGLAMQQFAWPGSPPAQNPDPDSRGWQRRSGARGWLAPSLWPS